MTHTTLPGEHRVYEHAILATTYGEYADARVETNGTVVHVGAPVRETVPRHAVESITLRYEPERPPDEDDQYSPARIIWRSPERIANDYTERDHVSVLEGGWLRLLTEDAHWWLTDYPPHTWQSCYWRDDT